MGLLSVDITAPKKSFFDRSLKKRTSMSPGVLYPVLIETCLPGDEIKIDIKSLVKTNALLAPLMGTFKLQFDMYFVPWRLYIKDFRKNRTSLGKESFEGMDLPYFAWPSVQSDPNFANVTNNGLVFDPRGYRLTDDQEEHAIPWMYTCPAGSLWDYLGFPVGYQNMNQSSYQEEYAFLPILGYIDIFRNYYMNPQETFHRWFGVKHWSSYFGEPDYVSTDVLENICGYDFDADNMGHFLMFMFPPIDSVASVNGTMLGFLSSGSDRAQLAYNGLFCRTHRPDLYSTMLNSQYVNSLVSSTRLNVQNSQLTIDQIRSGFKHYRAKAISLLVGGRFDEWVRGQFGIATDLDSVIPELLGTTSSFIEFEDVVSKSTSTDANGNEEPLGSLAGRGVGYLNGRQHYFRPREYGHLMVIASIQPMVDYYQGASPWLKDINMDDIFLPALDNIGFEDVPRAELSVFPDTNANGLIDLTQTQATADIWGVAIKKRPSWIKYHTNVNRLHGDFADTLRYWTLGRQFSENVFRDYTKFDSSSYIDPREFSYIFADPMEQNFFVQMSFNMLWKRPISKRLMPHL